MQDNSPEQAGAQADGFAASKQGGESAPGGAEAQTTDEAKAMNWLNSKSKQRNTLTNAGETASDPENTPPSRAPAGKDAAPAPKSGGQAAESPHPKPDGTPAEEYNIDEALQDKAKDPEEDKRPSLTPDPADVNYDPPLIQCLTQLFKMNGRAVSSNILKAGLPASSGPLHPSACIRAANAAGLQCKTMYRPTLRQISNLTLPCILLLKHEKACILVKLTDHGAEAVFPEVSEAPRAVSLEELEAEYLGYAIYAKAEAKLDERASKINLLKTKRWFWDTLRYFTPIYGHVVLASIVVNMFAISSPLFMMNVYDRVVPNKATESMWVLYLGVVLVFAFDFILRNLRSYFVDVAGRNADIILASRLMQQLMAMKMDVKPDSTGSLANNLREFESLREFFGSTTLLALADLPFLVIFIILVAYIGGPVAIVPAVAVPLVIGAGVLLQFPMQRVTAKGFKENMQKNAMLVEIINGLDTIKTSMAEGRMQGAWEKVVGLSAASNSQSKRMTNLSMTLSLLAAQLVAVSVILWGYYLTTEQLLSTGGLIACSMLSSRAMAPLSQIAAMLTRLQHSRMALKSLDMLMEMPTEQSGNDNYVEFGHLEHDFNFEEVSFKYPGSERYALDRVNLHIKPGEKVGIIGRMGSGKSTMSRLAVGLYQPAEGAIKFGGVDIRQLDTVTLRSRVGFVSQDNYLFYGTVRENISFGAVNIDDRMILRAANIAGVTDFVRSHPSGFGMQVGERGMTLSGGQRQSVAIARALLHDPDVLILDEPSSNMDNGSELLLKQRLAATLQNKTLILITHRLSMLDLVDRLVVMDGGRIMADGPKHAVLNALRNEQIRANTARIGRTSKPQQPVFEPGKKPPADAEQA